VVRPKLKKQPRKSASKARTFVAPGPLPVSMDLLTAGVQVELDADLELDRQRRAEALKAKLTRMLAQGNGAAAIDQMMSLMQEMERTNDRLAWRVLLANRYRFGRSTEKLSRDEIKQLYLVFGGDTAIAETQVELPVPAPAEPEQFDAAAAALESEAESESDATPAVPVEPKKKKRKRVRSIQVAPDVERNETTSLVPEEERACALCGKEKKSFGCVEHQLITWVPAKIVVEVERREKLACQSCRKDVSVAPRSQTPSVVRRVDASLLAKLVDEKCALALPVDRQRRELARLGLDIPDKTLQSYWGYTTDLLEPIAVATLSEVFGSSIVGADDSHLKTLDKSRKHGVSRAHLWCFVGSGNTVGGPESIAYGYTPSWDATEIIDWFSAIDGFIQCDGYAGYSREIEDDDGQTLVAVPPERRLGCGMHIRSKFHAALLAKDGRASIPLKIFADLYKVEDDCKARGLDADARCEERRRRSAPLLDVVDDWVDKLHPKLLPKSPLRRATTYAINQRPFFRRCFDDGRFEIDNGRVERRIRLFAVARRNFLFTGSARGGERLAIAFTLVDNCLALGVEPHRYLVDVIGKIEAGWPMQRLSDLIPHRWAAQQSADKRSQ
jgi:transposase